MLAISKGYIMVTKNKPATAPAALKPQTVAIPNWQQAGLTAFSQLVIGNGPNPTHIPNPNTAAGKRKQVLLNNAMAGQTVAQYYAAAKAAGYGKAGTNNAVLCHKVGLITLQLPK